MRIVSFLKTTTFRLALLYAGLFCASFIGIFAVVYWTTDIIATRERQRVIRDDVESLRGVYEQDGLAGLGAALLERTGPGRAGDSIYILARPDFQPIAGNARRAHVLEANRVGWGCSGRNGGFCSIGIGKEDFGDWIARFGLKRAKATFEVGREAVRTVQDIIADEKIDCDRTPEGGLELAHRPNRLPEMEARAKRMNELFGLDSEMLSKADLDGGYLASREAHGTVLHKEGFAVHALKYARGLARAALSKGALIHGASPVTGWRRDGRLHLLRTPAAPCAPRRW